MRGDAAAAAKALRDFGQDNPALVVKGGLLGDAGHHARPTSTALADLPSREVLLAQIAGVFQAPLIKAAGLFQAFTRNFAYGVQGADRPARRRRRGRSRGAEPEAPAEAEASPPPRPTGRRRRGARRRGAEPRRPAEADSRAEAPEPSRPDAAADARRVRVHRVRVNQKEEQPWQP